MTNSSKNETGHVPGFHEKGWGHELWIVNNEKYCGKLLHFKQGKRCSWHFHKLKDETFYLQSGQLQVWFSDDDDHSSARVRYLNPGDSMHIYPGLRHQMLAIKESELFEFSTQHFDTDSYRIKKGD